MRIQGIALRISHERIEQEHLDPRLGGSSGYFGFEHDPLGLLRYSVLSFDLDDEAERRLLEASLGDRLSTWRLSPTARRAKLAMVVCGAFLDHFRSVGRDERIELLGADPLAYIRYQDDRDFSEIRLYGGGITSPAAGMAEDTLTSFEAELNRNNDPPAWRLAVLDAFRTARRGLAAPALISALGALETALNAYFAAVWRGAARRTTREAAEELAISPRRSKTIEDVLREGDLRKKIAAFVRRLSVDPNWELALNLAIDARNDAVHGGITVPLGSTLRHIRAIGTFLEEQQLMLLAVAAPVRPRILDSFLEATEVVAPPSLERVVDRFLVPFGLDAILYNDSPTRLKGPAVDEYGRTIVVWMPLHHPMMTPERLALHLARIAIAFSLRYQGRIPRARVGELPFYDPSGGFATVAWEFTRAVWEIGIDGVLEAEEMGDAIAADINDRAAELRRRFNPPYDEPPPRTLLDYTSHVEVARVATVVSPSRQNRLLERIEAVAPPVAQRARRCMPLLAQVDLEDHDSIREALVCLHDDAPMLLASVVVVDPETRLLYGNGLVPNPQPQP
jgi:hypothetical protein